MRDAKCIWDDWKMYSIIATAICVLMTSPMLFSESKVESSDYFEEYYLHQAQRTKINVTNGGDTKKNLALTRISADVVFYKSYLLYHIKGKLYLKHKSLKLFD